MPALPVMSVLVDGYDPTLEPVECVAMIDSGADATMLPLDLLQSINAEKMQLQNMRGVTGNPVLVRLYLVSVTIGEIVVTGIKAIGTPAGSECIIGRDVLNQLQVTLDGFALEVRVWDYND